LQSLQSVQASYNRPQQITHSRKWRKSFQILKLFRNRWSTTE